jgi:iron complex outermembrane receptor protein
LIPDATTNDFGVFGLLITNNNSALQAGLRFDNRKIATTENGIWEKKVILKQSINHSIALMLP